MDTNIAIQGTIDCIKNKIADLQNLITSLERFRDGKSLLDVSTAAPAPIAPPQKIQKRRGRAAAAPVSSETPATPPAIAGTVLKWDGLTNDKPESIGAAMKWAGKKLRTFTRQQMKDIILADADWSKLHGQSPTQFSGNLIYWSSSGKLKRTGEGDTERFEVVNLDF